MEIANTQADTRTLPQRPCRLLSQLGVPHLWATGRFWPSEQEMWTLGLLSAAFFPKGEQQLKTCHLDYSEDSSHPLCGVPQAFSTTRPTDTCEMTAVVQGFLGKWQWEQAAAIKKSPRLTAKYPTAPKKTQHDKFQMCSHTCEGVTATTNIFCSHYAREGAGHQVGRESKPSYDCSTHSSAHSKENNNIANTFPCTSECEEKKNTLWQVAFQTTF